MEEIERTRKPPIISKNWTCCWGHCFYGPSICSGSFIILVVLAIGGLSLAALIPRMHFTVSIVEGILGMGLTLVILIILETTDPGILPKAHQLPPGHYLLPKEQPIALFNEITSIQEQNNQNEMIDQVENSPLNRTASDDAHIQTKIDVVGNKVCKICGIMRPKGCKHCYECGNCVMGFDHHCPVVNNCIGERNQGLFMWFLMSCAFSLIMYGITAFVIFIIDITKVGWENATKQDMFLIGVVLYCTIVSIILLPFSFFHAYLLWTDQSTVGRIYGIQNDNKKGLRVFLSRACRLLPTFVTNSGYKKYKRCWPIRCESLYKLNNPDQPMESEISTSNESLCRIQNQIDVSDASESLSSPVLNQPHSMLHMGFGTSSDSSSSILPQENIDFSQNQTDIRQSYFESDEPSFDKKS